MSESENRLLSLLEGSGRTLVNFKFFPGEAPTSGLAMCNTAADWLMQVRERPNESVLPVAGRAPVHFAELFD